MVLVTAGEGREIKRGSTSDEEQVDEVADVTN